ncbi:MAG TPA: DUF2935 domain-containing protein [Verrucomicrobiae bacterium]|nr:DUF2935 domain-containing protein [Verrucomicrobiae bacterium]
MPRIGADEFVRLSLELHLFFLRIMKEHSLFLEAGFVAKNADLAKQADNFKEQFNQLLHRAVALANRNVSRVVLNSGEVVTDKTLRAELKTQELSGITIDTQLTEEELRLMPGRPDPSLESAVSELNEAAIQLTLQLIEFKTMVLDEMLQCRLFTFNFPLLIDHIRREARFFVEHLRRLQNRQLPDVIRDLIEEKAFWDRIMAEHAEFIAHLLDPTETGLINTAGEFADLFNMLERRIQRVTLTGRGLGPLVNEEIQATRSIRNFKATATEEILACNIKSIIIPLLGDHVLREANHFLRILTNPQSDV